MSTLSIIKGNIFRSDCQTLVNTVNCFGIMGAGIALECRLRYPDMFDRYRVLCEEKKLDVGRLWLFKADDRWVLNFPTKKHWKDPSKPEYLHAGLQRFVETHEERGITSIAFPLLGASHGGLPPQVSLDLMRAYLERCNLRVEIYEYDPQAADDLFDDFKHSFLTCSDQELKEGSGLRSDAVRHIREALKDPSIRQMNQLARVPRIGDKTLEKSFRFIRRYKDGGICQPLPTPTEQASFSF